uniref:Uncharacterized protein n=1 Tax=Rhizophora mucronata TaxID=61149 RepID=A0A2P2PUQ9_RHIMU
MSEHKGSNEVTHLETNPASTFWCEAAVVMIQIISLYYCVSKPDVKH